MSNLYDLTDAYNKFHTLLFEIRSKSSPKRLKIEVRKEIKECDYQDKIAFSKYTTTQVMLRVHTLDQMLKNKIEAAIDRKDIRDCFDIEFLLRQGASSDLCADKASELEKVISLELQ